MAKEFPRAFRTAIYRDKIYKDDGTKHLLFQLESWEIVKYDAYAKAYAVHNCPAGDGASPSGGNVVECSEQALDEFQGKPVACWHCQDPVPDEIITITELYNG